MLIAFSIYSDAGAPVLSATPAFVRYVDTAGVAQAAPVIAHLGDGVYGFTASTADVADGRAYLIETGHSPAYVAGALGIARFVAFAVYDAAGTPLPGATPVFAAFRDEYGGPLPLPDIAELGGGLYGFDPGSLPCGFDVSTGAEPANWSGSWNPTEAPEDAPGVQYRACALADNMLRRGHVPRDSQDLSRDVLLGILSDELRGYVVDLLREAGGEHLVVPHVIQIQPGVTTYRLPPRAVANGVRRVSVVAGDGVEVQLPQVSPDALDASLSGYYLRGAHLVLHPPPTGARSLRVDYLLRPGQLVCERYGVVQSVATDGRRATITVGWEGSTIPSGRVDIIRALPPFDALAVDIRATVAGQLVVVWLRDLGEAPEVGDYVCAAGESPVPQVPLELHALLSQRAAWAALSQLGDPGADAAFQRAEDMRAQMLTLLAPRDIGARHFVRGGLSRGSFRRWR